MKAAKTYLLCALGAVLFAYFAPLVWDYVAIRAIGARWQNAIIVLVEHKLPPAEISDAQINGRQWTSPTAEFKKPYAGSPSSIAGRK